MKKFILNLTIVALLGCGTGLFAPVQAQTPAPAPANATTGANSHAELEAALQQLNLRPRQKIQILEIVKNAKASGQDKKITMEQVGAVLDPGQKQQLMGLMKAAKDAKQP